MNILFLEEFYCQKDLIKILKEEKQILEVYYDSDIKSKLEVNIIFTRLKFFLDKKLLSKYPNLKFIVTPTTGLTHIDIEYCDFKNIRIISLKNKTKILNKFTGTAELALGLMIALNLNLNKVINSTKKGIWDRNIFMSYQLFDKNLGIIGFGRLGKMLSNYCQSLGMKILCYDPKKIIKDKNIKQVDLNYLLQKSDFISINASYQKQDNFHLVGQTEIDLMKENAIVVNTARGELLDLKYLIKKLEQKKIRGIGIDTIENEYYIDKKILSLQQKYNIIFTPHIGGCKFESTVEAEKIVCNSLIETLNDSYSS